MADGWQRSSTLSPTGWFVELCSLTSTQFTKKVCMGSIMIAHNSDYWPVCQISHTSCYAESFVFTSIIVNNSSERTVCHISHTHWYGCPFLLFYLIANSSYGSTVCSASHTQLNSDCVWCSHHRNRFAPFLMVILNRSLRLLHHTQIRRRVSDHSVALVASCSSDIHVLDPILQVIVTYYVLWSGTPEWQ